MATNSSDEAPFCAARTQAGVVDIVVDMGMDISWCHCAWTKVHGIWELGSSSEADNVGNSRFIRRHPTMTSPSGAGLKNLSREAPLVPNFGNRSGRRSTEKSSKIVIVCMRYASMGP